MSVITGSNLPRYPNSVNRSQGRHPTIASRHDAAGAALRHCVVDPQAIDRDWVLVMLTS
jgi:hypothetical protein